MRSCKFWGATLALVVAIHASSIQISHATPVNVSFSGASQAFVGVASVFGTLTATGNGVTNSSVGLEPFVLTPPTVHPITLAGGFALVDSQPNSVGPTSVFDVTPTAINKITNLNVDLLNGTVVPILFNTINITSNSSVNLLKNISVDASVDADGLEFFQTGLSTLTPLGPNFGNFSVPGNFYMHASNFVATLFGVLNFPLGNVSEIIPGALSGTYTISGPPNNTKITLDGTLALQVPINAADDFVLNVSSPFALTVSATAAAAATLLINVGFHLEQDQIVVPEPGSIALLGIGVAMCGTAVWRRRRQSR